MCIYMYINKTYNIFNDGDVMFQCVRVVEGLGSFTWSMWVCMCMYVCTYLSVYVYNKIDVLC